MSKTEKCSNCDAKPPKSKKLKKSKKRTSKDKLDHIEINLDYDLPSCYNVTVNGKLKDIDFTAGIEDIKELRRAAAIQLASVALVEMGLPSIQEILEEHYPESLL